MYEYAVDADAGAEVRGTQRLLISPSASIVHRISLVGLLRNAQSALKTINKLLLESMQEDLGIQG